MVKSLIQWLDPTAGQEFTFEYEVTRSHASTVKNVHGTIYAATSSDTDDANEHNDGPKQKRAKGETEVGYMKGYELRRGSDGNKMFHEHADEVSRELSDFATALFDDKGKICRAPRSSGMWDVLHMDGSMLLIEMIEITPEFRGRDLGIHFIHEYLSQPTVAKRVGLVVMFPWALDSNILRYEESRTCFKQEREGKSKSEIVDIIRSNTVKLRKQYSRMGFQAIGETPNWVNKWWMNMNKYKTMNPDDVKRAWLSKEEASRLDIPMPKRPHVFSDADNELKELIQSLKPDPPDPFAHLASHTASLRQEMEKLRQTFQATQERVRQVLNPVLGLEGAADVVNQSFRSPMSRLEEAVASFPEDAAVGSKLTNDKKADIRRLVNSGADLNGIDALHIACGMYCDSDLFDLLLDEYGMNIEQFDKVGSRPLHIAASLGNADAVRILLSKGADKNGKNEEGRTALEDVNYEQRRNPVAELMVGQHSGGRADFIEVRRLLRR